MTDDFSNLETGASCYAISNPTTIYSYKASVRTTYIQIGGKWYKTSTSSYYNIPDSTSCLSYSDITKINSNSAFYPQYMMFAFCLSVFVWLVVFKLLGRLVKWRS